MQFPCKIHIEGNNRLNCIYQVLAMWSDSIKSNHIYSTFIWKFGCKVTQKNWTRKTFLHFSPFYFMFLLIIFLSLLLFLIWWQNYTKSRKAFCNFSSKICIFSSKWIHNILKQTQNAHFIASSPNSVIRDTLTLFSLLLPVTCYRDMASALFLTWVRRKLNGRTLWCWTDNNYQSSTPKRKVRLREYLWKVNEQ